MKTYKRVFIIDDNKSFHRKLILKLNKYSLNFKIHSIFSAQNAIQYLEENSPLTAQDVIITDIVFKDIRGEDFLKQLNKLLLTQIDNTDVFIASNSLDPFEINKCKKVTFVQDFFPKPIVNEDVVTILKQGAHNGTNKKISPSKIA